MLEQTTLQPEKYLLYDNGEIKEIAAPIVGEMLLNLYINGQEWVTIVCSPDKLNVLVLGFLLSEKIVDSLDEVLLMRVCQDEGLADVRIIREVTPPVRRILTSGCGGGTTFTDLLSVEETIDSQIVLPHTQIPALMSQFHESAEAYKKSRGIHTSVLSDGEELLAVAEDIGRHNTLDRLRGEAALRNIDTADKIVISSGRISSEMLRKVAQMRIPIVISRSSASSLSVQLAKSWGITLVGYAYGHRFQVYTHSWRIA